MDQVFCTLFNSGYIDKGLVLYDSMCETIGDFRLYIFAFDDTCYKILSQMNLRNAIIISLKDFETKELLEVKKERTFAEYCWTCTPWVIKHVLEHFDEKICTYIDADMMFFSSPQPVFDDMKASNCSIIIVPHRFKNEKQEKRECDRVGTYCVEFNTFMNDDAGREALNWWADKCLEWCFYAVPGATEWYGDQKYLNAFPELFGGVYICSHAGVGLAPWNSASVDYVDCNPLTIKDKKNNEVFPLIIYHFAQMTFLSSHILNVYSGLKSKKLHACIYDEYVRRIVGRRIFLKDKYNFHVPKKRRTVTKNIFMKIYQRYVAPVRQIKKLSDLYWIKDE